MKKRILAMALTLTMVLTLLPANAFAVNYQDTANHWANAEIEKWSDLDIFQGSSGTFHPNVPMTRAEFATVMDKIMGYKTKGSNTFTDLGQEWYKDVMLRATAAGIFVGSNGKITPRDNISREQTAVVMCRVFGIEPMDGVTNYADDELIASWAKGYVKAATAAGFFGGVGENKFEPQKDINRASVVKMLDNAITCVVNTTEEQTGTAEGNVIVNRSGAVLKDMTIKGSLIIAEGVGEGDVTLDGVTVAGDTIIRGGGANSIHIKGDSKLGKVIVSKTDDGAIFIKITGNAKVDVVVSENGTINISGTFSRLDVRGDAAVSLVGAKITKVNVESKGASFTLDKESEVKTLEVKAPKTQLVMAGTVGTVTVTAEASHTAITTESTAKISNVIVQGQGATISGTGVIAVVKAEANNIAITTPNTKVEVAPGVTGVTAGGTAVAGGSTVTINSTGNGSVKGTTSSGGGGSGSGNDGGGNQSKSTYTLSVDRNLPAGFAVTIITAASMKPGSTYEYMVTGTAPQGKYFETFLEKVGDSSTTAKCKGGFGDIYVGEMPDFDAVIKVELQDSGNNPNVDSLYVFWEPGIPEDVAMIFQAPFPLGQGDKAYILFKELPAGKRVKEIIIKDARTNVPIIPANFIMYDNTKGGSCSFTMPDQNLAVGLELEDIELNLNSPGFYLKGGENFGFTVYANGNSVEPNLMLDWEIEGFNDFSNENVSLEASACASTPVDLTGMVSIDSAGLLTTTSDVPDGTLLRVTANYTDADGTVVYSDSVKFYVYESDRYTYHFDTSAGFSKGDFYWIRVWADSNDNENLYFKPGETVYLDLFGNDTKRTTGITFIPTTVVTRSIIPTSINFAHIKFTMPEQDVTIKPTVVNAPGN